MTAIKPDGTRSKQILAQVEQRLAANQRVLFDVALLIYGGNKAEAMRMLKPIADNNSTALRVLTLIRAGEYAEADDVIMDEHRSSKGEKF